MLSCLFAAIANIISKCQDPYDEAEQKALKVLNKLKAQRSGKDVLSLVYEEHGIKIEYLFKTNSIAWYIMCETIANLQHLRQLFDSKRLQIILQEIFSHAAEFNEPVQLDVDWSYENYQECFEHLRSSRNVGSDGSLKRRLEDTEPVQPTKRQTPSTEIGGSSSEDHNGNYNVTQLLLSFCHSVSL